MACQHGSCSAITGGGGGDGEGGQDVGREGEGEGEGEGRGRGAGALLVDQADLEVVEVSALELLLELMEGMLDLVLEAVVIITVVVLGPVAVSVGLMRMRHGQGGGGADELEEGVGDPGAEGKKSKLEGGPRNM